MRSLIFIFIILSFSALSTQFAVDDGISIYCEKGRRHTFLYGAIPVECCNHRGKCDKYIGPNESKYGLTNPDPEWPRRLCSCDLIFYECATENWSAADIAWSSFFGFSRGTCFRQIQPQINGTNEIERYEFVPITDSLRITRKQFPNSHIVVPIGW